MSVPSTTAAAQPRNRRYLIVLATATVLAAGATLAPAANAADKWGPGYQIPDSAGHANASHIGAYGPPGAAIPGLNHLAYCADPDLVGPAGSGGYTAPETTSAWTSKITGTAVPAANVAQAAYILSVYGQTTSDTQAAAVDAATYTELNPGTTYALPSGARALQRLSYPVVPAIAKTLAGQYLANAAEYAGPYTVEIHPAAGAKTGEKSTVSLDVLSSTGHRLPDAAVSLTVGSGTPQILTTGDDGTATTTVTPTATGSLDLTATAATLPGVTLNAALPVNSGAQRMLLAGGTSSATAHTQRTVTAPKGSIKIVKSAADTGKPMAGVRFEVRDSTGKTVATGTTNAAGIWEANDLAPGIYTIHELKAVNGYELAPDQLATVADGTVTVAVRDVRIPTQPTPAPRPVTITTLPKTGA